MREVNGLFGREVVIQDTGEKASKVQDVVFDEPARRIVALLISDGLLESARVIAWEDVVGISDVVVVRGGVDFKRLKDDAGINDLHKRRYKITKTDVIHDGEKAGTIDDIFIDDAGVVVGYEVKQGLLSANKFLPIEEVESSGRDAIVIRTADLPSVKDVKR